MIKRLISLGRVAHAFDQDHVVPPPSVLFVLDRTHHYYLRRGRRTTVSI